jgi:Synergist-CTERM protein sorting domain-containing protein
LKKIVVVMMALMVAVAFAGMAFAAVGHVGHVNSDSTVVVDFTSPTAQDIDVENGSIISVISVTKEEIEEYLPSFSFVGGLPADKTYEMTVHNAVTLNVTGYDPNIPMKFDFTAVDGDWTGVMVERTEGDVFDYFPKEGDGFITIETPSDYFSESGILFVELEEVPTSTGGGGDSGCSLGMLSPFALLLAVPLVLLRK